MTTTIAILAMTTVSRYLSAMWKEVAPALGNHLWQSTLFAIAAGLLTLLLRKNQARARYGLWLAASLKFLIPFSWLVGIGSHLPWPHGSAGTNPSLYLVIEETVISPANSSTLFQSLIHLLPAMLAVVWLGGLLVVLAIWCAGWRRISAAMREAVPSHEGREVQMLRNVEAIAGTARPIQLLLSPAFLEPGIFGIVRPALLWPKAISERLDDAHLRAILAHEVCHVRRRDNLAAAMHMIVEAIFWFHPLVWWLGARLVEERERACDEEVLHLGSEPNVYAEGILKVCEFCVESPLACMAGVTGADLKKRMVSIMNENVTRKLDLGRKLLLTVAGFLAITMPIVLGMLHATPSLAQSQSDKNAPTSQNPPAYIHVSKDVMQGLILSKVNPKYPDEARKARIQGTVLLTAVISKSGDIKYVDFVSGPPMLITPSMDAVQQWKYKPFLLNGKPVEVVTKIEVNYKLAD